MASYRKKPIITDEDRQASEAMKEQRITSALDKVLKMFEEGKAPAATAHSIFASADTPCGRWSFLNQLIVGSNDTFDARTFKQWQAVNRTVKKGAKAFYVFAPNTKSFTETDTDGNEEKKSFVTGFRLMAVFAVQDTEGEPLPLPTIELKNLPFIERAREWNIEVSALGFMDLQRRLCGTPALGVRITKISGAGEEKEEIVLATPETSVFFHELAHAAQARLHGRRINRDQQLELHEVVAEFSAAVLSEMTGISTKMAGNSYQYIKRYADQAKLDLHKALNMVLGDVKGVLSLILGDHLEMKSC